MSRNPRTKDTMLNEEQRFSPEKFAQNCVTIIPFSPPSFIQHPFLRQPPAISHVVGQVHDSNLSSVDNFLSMLHGLASQNPLITKLFSFSSHLQNSICQIPCRIYGNLDIRSNHKFAAILPGDSVAGIVVTNGILNFLNIYNTLLIARLVLTWFPSAPPAVVSPLSTICDPYLNIFRGIIPPLGGTLDLSPILAFLVLNAFTSAAAALPAELPSTGVSQNLPSHRTVLHLSTSQGKWMRRLAGDKSRNSSNEN